MIKTISARGLALIERFEGFRPIAYQDGVGIWTDGWGHTGADVGPGSTVDVQQATENLQKDTAYAVHVVQTSVTVGLNQNQFDALVSFVFNVGAGARGVKDGFVTLRSGAPSSMLRFINAGNFTAAAAQFPLWNRAGGVVENGLTLRREAERDLFLSAV